MKTKEFLLATSGATVDGRNIDDKMLQEMASSYDPKTYGARVNIEHIRGISGDGPFRAYGDVLSLSTREVEVNFNGKTEKRTGLFGVFDVTADAKKLNEAGQKVYPSIEIEPNFAGKGFAYLVGCAFTDSPASIATQRLQFNRTLPGVLTVAGEDSALLEFPDETTEEAGAGLMSSVGRFFDSLTAKFGGGTPPEQQQQQQQNNQADPAQPAAFNVADLKPLFTELAKGISTDIGALRTEFRAEMDTFGLDLVKLKEEFEGTPARDLRPGQFGNQRPRSDGKAGQYDGVF